MFADFKTSQKALKKVQACATVNCKDTTAHQSTCLNVGKYSGHSFIDMTFADYIVSSCS